MSSQAQRHDGAAPLDDSAPCRGRSCSAWLLPAPSATLLVLGATLPLPSGCSAAAVGAAAAAAVPAGAAPTAAAADAGATAGAGGAGRGTQSGTGAGPACACTNCRAWFWARSMRRRHSTRASMSSRPAATCRRCWEALERDVNRALREQCRGRRCMRHESYLPTPTRHAMFCSNSLHQGLTVRSTLSPTSKISSKMSNQKSSVARRRVRAHTPCCPVSE